MSGKSPNFIPSPRFSNGTPSRNQQFNHRQPLHLPPNSPFMSPRTNQSTSPRSRPRPCGFSPDFIPIGISSPVNRGRQNWSRGNYSNSSSYSAYSNSSTPSSFNSSYGPGYSPYKRHSSSGKFRGRGSFNHSGSGSPPVHLYYDKEALEDPWAELAAKLEKKEMPVVGRVCNDSEETVLLESSGSEVSEDDES